MKNKSVTGFVVQGAIIAALYTALTYIIFLFGLAFGAPQFRVSEALTILPALSPVAIIGLTVGCFLSNIPNGLLDMAFGTLATLIAAVLTYRLRNIKIKGIPFLAPLPPVLVNALIIPFVIMAVAGEGFAMPLYVSYATGIAASQFVVCYFLGLPLYAALSKIKNLFS